MTHATWQDETASLWHALDANIEDLTQRLDALEARLPAPIPVVTPLASTLELGTPELCANCLVRHRPSENTLCPGFRAAKDGPSCVCCGGSVEADRHCYVHPTCYRCLPPPEPVPVLPIGPGVAPQNIALPDYVLAPAPDYRSELPAEVEPCGCEEAEALRAELGAASVELKQLANRVDIDAGTIAQLTERAEAAERECAALRSELERLRAATSQGLLQPAGSKPPPGCHCPPGRCGAPRIMGRQMPCRRQNGGAADPV